MDDSSTKTATNLAFTELVQGFEWVLTMRGQADSLKLAMERAAGAQEAVLKDEAARNALGHDMKLPSTPQ